MSSDSYRRHGRMGPTSILTLVIAFVASGVLNASSAGAAGTLDQSQETVGTCSASSVQAIGQTFTAGITGNLDQVDVFFGRFSFDNSPFTVSIHAVNQASPPTPSSTVLASASIPAASVPTYLNEDFVSVPIGPVPVTAGTQYAWVVKQNGSGVIPCFASDAYAGGNFVSNFGGGWFSATTLDGAFRTYVTPSPPPNPCRIIKLTIPLLGLAPPIVVCL